MELASLEIRISRSENLPIMSQAASAVLRLVDDINTGPREIEKSIQQDPAITAKILKVANSAFYGGLEIPTVNRAIQFLGMNSIRSLVVGIAFQQMIGGKEGAPSFNKVEFWRHSLATATAARILGKMKVPFLAEELFCAGMMHDVGMLVCDRHMPDEFQDALELCQQTRRPLFEIERQMHGFDHGDVGGMLADNWKLSKVIRHAIKYHHNPALDGDYYESTCIIAASNVIAHQCGFTNNTDKVEMQFDAEVALAIGLPTEQFATIQNVVIAEVNRAQEAFRL